MTSLEEKWKLKLQEEIIERKQCYGRLFYESEFKNGFWSAWGHIKKMVWDAQGNFASAKNEAAYHALCDLEAYIDSLAEESESKDLKEAAENHALQCHSKKASVATLAASIYDFRAGANWKEQQMMKDAIEGLVVCDEKLTRGYRDIVFKFPDNLQVGDKVKMIIVKEDEVWRV